MPNNKTGQSIRMYIPEQLRSGVYSNIANVHLSKKEVVIDFIFITPGEANLVSRVILPIDHAEALEKVLSNLLKNRK